MYNIYMLYIYIYIYIYIYRERERERERERVIFSAFVSVFTFFASSKKAANFSNPFF